MRDLLKGILKELTWWDRLVALFMAAVILITFWVIQDAVHNRLNRMDSGTVVEKHYHGPYTSLISSGKTTVPVHQDETFTLLLTDCQKNYRTTVPEFLWREAKEGDTVNLKTMEVSHAAN